MEKRIGPIIHVAINDIAIDVSLTITITNKLT